jgi:hypothetical protein
MAKMKPMDVAVTLPPLGPADLLLVKTIGFSLLVFTIYWFFIHSNWLKSQFYKGVEFDQASVRHLFFTKVLGFVMFGFLPSGLLMMGEGSHGWEVFGLNEGSRPVGFTWAWTLMLGFLVVPMAFFSARKPANLLHYPQIRAKKWTVTTMLLNVLGWSLYLLGYEIMFRSTLFLMILPVWGLYPALIVNVALYSATHLPKGLSETLGAIPLGVVLCLLTAASGTIWIAFWVHLLLALTNSFTAFYYQTDMVFTGFKPKR